MSIEIVISGRDLVHYRNHNLKGNSLNNPEDLQAQGDAEHCTTDLSEITAKMLTCCGLFPSKDDDREREPLLPCYNDETTLQNRLHEKLHTYQMLRALSKGYMPTNEQVIIHLRTLLSADILNPDVVDLSDSGRALVRSLSLWLKQFIELLQHKNERDQIQDFIWYLSKSRVDVDVADIGHRASRAKVRADAAATYRSLQTVGSLLLTNSDFRIFLSDLGTVGREVLRDTASKLADATKEAAKKIEPSKEEQHRLKNANGDSRPAPSNQDLREDLNQVSQAVTEGMAEVADGAGQSLKEHVQGDEQEALVRRLKETVRNLRQHTDYSESVSALSSLIRRYLLVYSHAAVDTVQAVEEDAHTNPEADRALHNFWLFVTSLGDHAAWDEVEKSFKSLAEDSQADPNFDELARQIGNLIRDILTDPSFFDNAEKRFKDMKDKSNDLAEKSSIREDLDAFIEKLRTAFQSVLEDGDVKKLVRTSERIAHILSPTGQYANSELLGDSVNIFVPLIVQAIQFIPIPRLEVATPAIDLLLENLILEPGRTVNHTSFLPYKLNISTQNDFEVRKARLRTTSSMTSLVSIKISGLSIAAEDLGFWLRLHSGLFRMMDEGIAGLHLDERGVDISLDVEICRERLEQMVTLRNVNVHIHHLNYKLRKSKFACLAWLFKPVIRPMVRKALEAKMADGISEGLHTLNRELIYARERLRAARIANPADLWTFVRAVVARLVPAPDPDIEARVGVRPGRGVFRGRYAPGSLVRLWEEEGRMAEQRVYEYEREGWKNEIFDVRTAAAV